MTKGYRCRISYAFTVLIIIVLGISSRKFSAHLPFFIADNGGDVLWAAMVYFGFRCSLIRKSLQWALVCSITFSFLIEISQLYQAEWINEVRQTTPGALVLGRGFLMVDLVRYLFGIVVSFLADSLILKYLLSRPSRF